jgi:non-heme chloroperoxidase
MQHAKTRDGTELAYKTRGSGENTLIIQPAWGCTSVGYDAFCDAMALTGWRVITLDPRGTGQSGKPDGGYTVEGMGQDVIDLADAVKAERFVLFGHSLGGKVARYVSCSWPERVQGQLLLCPVAAAPMPLPPEFAGLMRAVPGNPLAFWTFISTGLMTMPPGNGMQDIMKDVSACDPKAMSKMLEGMILGGTSFVDKQSKTRAKTLFITTDDAFFSQQAMAHEAAAIPNARLCYLPGPGHWANFTHPRELAAIVAAYCVGLG